MCSKAAVFMQTMSVYHLRYLCDWRQRPIYCRNARTNRTKLSTIVQQFENNRCKDLATMNHSLCDLWGENPENPKTR